MEAELAKIKSGLLEEVDARLNRRLTFLGAMLGALIAVLGAIIGGAIVSVAENVVGGEVGEIRSEMEGLAVSLNIFNEVQNLEEQRENDEGISIDQVITIMNGLDFIAENKEVRIKIRDMGYLDRILNRTLLYFVATRQNSNIDKIVSDFQQEILLNTDTSDTVTRHYAIRLVSQEVTEQQYLRHLKSHYSKFKESARINYPETVLLHDILIAYGEMERNDTLENPKGNDRILQMVRQIDSLSDIDRDNFVFILLGYISGESMAGGIEASELQRTSSFVFDRYEEHFPADIKSVITNGASDFSREGVFRSKEVQ